MRNKIRERRIFLILLSVYMVSIVIVIIMPSVYADNNTKYSSSINFYGEKTDVYMGEEIIVRLSIVNLDSNPKMHAQVIILPSSGTSVTSAEFTKVSAGQFANNYMLEPGDGRNIEIKLRSNQVGEFNIKGRVIYYFGNDSTNTQDYSLDLPVSVRRPTVLTDVDTHNEQPRKGSIRSEIIVMSIGMIAFVIIFSTILISVMRRQ